MGNLNQQIYDLEQKTASVVKLKSQQVINDAQRKLDFKVSYDASEVLLMLEDIKDKIGEVTS